MARKKVEDDIDEEDELEEDVEAEEELEDDFEDDDIEDEPDSDEETEVDEDEDQDQDQDQDQDDDASEDDDYQMTEEASEEVAESANDPMSGLAADVPVQVVAVLGKRSFNMQELMSFHVGQVVDLYRPANETVDLVVGGKLIAKGELVSIDGKLGVKILKLI